MHSIESELHTLLDDIAPDAHDINEKAIIVAEASAMFNKSLSKMTKTATKNIRLVESKMTDAILCAMSLVNNHDEFSDDIVLAANLSPEQIIRKASQTKSSFEGMHIINPDLLENLLSEEEEPVVLLDDTHHETSGFHTPGRGKVWSDSLSRN
jgi:hypothetical protein